MSQPPPDGRSFWQRHGFLQYVLILLGVFLSFPVWAPLLGLGAAWLMHGMYVVHTWVAARLPWP